MTEQARHEPIEDYCIRAGRVHPWALEAGTAIKVLEAEVVGLRKRIAEAERCMEDIYCGAYSASQRESRIQRYYSTYYKK